MDLDVLNLGKVISWDLFDFLPSVKPAVIYFWFRLLNINVGIFPESILLLSFPLASIVKLHFSKILFVGCGAKDRKRGCGRKHPKERS